MTGDVPVGRDRTNGNCYRTVQSEPGVTNVPFDHKLYIYEQKLVRDWEFAG